MKLPLENIYVFPELKFGVNNRKDLENILNNIFTYNKFSGDKIISFLEYYYGKECQKQAVILAMKTEVKPEEMELFKIKGVQKFED